MYRVRVSGMMGVPISFLGAYNPDQFRIDAMMSGAKGEAMAIGDDGAKFAVGGHEVFARMLITRIVRRS